MTCWQNSLTNAEKEKEQQAFTEAWQYNQQASLGAKRCLCFMLLSRLIIFEKKLFLWPNIKRSEWFLKTCIFTRMGKQACMCVGVFNTVDRLASFPLFCFISCYFDPPFGTGIRLNPKTLGKKCCRFLSLPYNYNNHSSQILDKQLCS